MQNNAQEENISALHGNTVMSSNLVITSQERDIEIFLNKDENTFVLVIVSSDPLKQRMK